MLNRASWIFKQKQDEVAKERENIETSKIYAEYVKEFELAESSGSKLSFVKASAGDKTARNDFPVAPSVANIFETQGDGTSLEEPHDPHSKEYLKYLQTASTTTDSKPVYQGKTRELDVFIQELKEKQQRHDEERVKQRLQSQPSSRQVTEVFGNVHGGYSGFSDVGPVSTGSATIYVDNLYPKINKEDIEFRLSRYGRITDIRIIPNKEPDHMATACALVTFTNPESAVRAKEEIDGLDILGYQCRITLAYKTDQSAFSVSNSPGSCVSISPHIPPPPPRPLLLADEKGVTVQIPFSNEKKKVIDLMATYLVEGGPEFESIILNNESPEGLFGFLYDRRSPEHVYYRWKVYSLLQGDVDEQHSTSPFNIVDGGLIWHPPSHDGDSGKSPSKDNVYTGHGFSPEKISPLHASGWKPLLDHDLDRLHEMLRNPSTMRSAIGEAMVFIIDHGESAYHVTDVLINAITEETEMIGTKISRLYIMSDVLYNSSASHQFAWVYRLSMEKRMPEVFDNLRAFIKTSTSKIAKEQLMDAAMKLLTAWRQWTVYTTDFLRGLQATLFGPDFESLEQSSTFKESETLINTNHDGEQMEYFDFLSKVPLKWRDTAYGYLLMRLKQLKKLCANNGLITYPDTRLELVARLITSEMYWDSEDAKCEAAAYGESQVVDENDHMSIDHTGEEQTEGNEHPVSVLPHIDSTLVMDENSDMEEESSDEREPPEDDIPKEQEAPLSQVEHCEKAEEPAQPPTVISYRPSEDDIDDIFAT